MSDKQPGGIDTVMVERVGCLATITLNAPERLNAVDTAMLETVLALVQEFDADPEIRTIALTGAGRGFCSGAFLPAEGERAPGSAIDDSTLYAAGRLSLALLNSATPTVALVNGVAAGVGLSLALACDYTLASESSSFMLAFSNIALMPDGGATALVTANVGRAKALRMALTAERVSAPTAEAWGLIAECVPDDDFADRAAAVIDRLCSIAPLSTAHTTAAISAAALDLQDALTREERDQATLLRSRDFAEGVAAFLNKRRPNFTGS